MKIILLLAGTAIALVTFILYSVSGSLIGKDTRTTLPKWISGAATLVLGGYFALVEWDSFISAWNRHILGVEEAPAQAQPADTTRRAATEAWSIFDMTSLPTPVAASAVVSETDPRVFAHCGHGHAVVVVSFFAGTPAFARLRAALPLMDQRVYSVGFRLDTGQLIVLPARLTAPQGADSESISFMMTTVPDSIGQTEGAVPFSPDQVDKVLAAVMEEEREFTLRITDGSATWTADVALPAQGLGRLWKTAAETAAAAGGDNASAACRAAMAG